ncbi:hypothetical protein LYNGBM3L_13950 [Moorena producens 3L]|uniref:Uncharacterized protein n=1 Tax=Moorena producens 3L TaxID=489825 RepID=F4XLA4_9CYAN|nr:hypothetical protein LYNGBM3L_13950 [Moorena producens 3L]
MQWLMEVPPHEPLHRFVKLLIRSEHQEQSTFNYYTIFSD